MRLLQRLLLIGLVLALIGSLPGSIRSSQASPAFQDDIARQQAINMLGKLTPEEKVGQLFLVTLNGTTFDENSQIYDLITRGHIGGVVLTRANDNFSWGDGSLDQVAALTNLLQQSALKASQQTALSPSSISFNPQYIPMLIGISQEGNSFPNDQILQGVTALPSLMSIGATWNPSMAEQAGTIMGQELAGLGFNLYLGPSLDILDGQFVSGSEDMGVRTFGGDPYWVGKMGKAYIAGLHQGSGNRMVVIAKHFPGRGGTDRAPDEEIPTVRRSLEQLLQVELAPFLAVTGKTAEPDQVTDGLLVSHIRYEGFQGNIRTTTRPVSSDAAAIDLIMNRESMIEWRANGGILVSDNLGSQAIRRFYDPSGLSFDARTAAREAFIAGNDLLFLDRFVGSNDPDSYTTIKGTLDFFAQKYREDDAFAQRVDASVQRILTLKYRLYPTFSIDSVVPPVNERAEIGKSQQVTFDIARRSVTLISPDLAELPNILPRPPELRDRIVFLTDVQTGRACSGCVDYIPLEAGALQNAVTRLYGPRAGGLVNQNLMISYSFSDLWKYLTGSPDFEALEKDLQLADWVVVSIIRPDPGQPETGAFERLLSERFDLLRNKKVIVFAFDAPYYLDATDISKLTAYYGLFSHTPEFVEVAARVLFNEQAAAGALPVSVPGAGYDLVQITSPDPNQVIPLNIDFPNVPDRPTPSTQQPTPEPIFEVGDILQLRTGVIYDWNHNPVPDGTPVKFIFNVISQESPTQMQMDMVTVDGIARTSYRIERSGVLEIVASSEQGVSSNLIRLDTVSGGVTVVAPTPQPTQTSTPTPTNTVTPTVTVTATPVPPVTVQVSDWLYGLVLILGSAIVIALIGIRRAIARWGLRWALCGVIGGMLGYNYLALGLPGSQPILRDNGSTGSLLVTLAGVVLGWIVGLVWRLIDNPGKRASGERAGRSSPPERPVTGPKSQSG